MATSWLSREPGASSGSLLWVIVDQVLGPPIFFFPSALAGRIVSVVARIWHGTATWDAVLQRWSQVNVLHRNQGLLWSPAAWLLTTVLFMQLLGTYSHIKVSDMSNIPVPDAHFFTDHTIWLVIALLSFEFPCPLSLGIDCDFNWRALHAFSDTTIQALHQVCAPPGNLPNS